MHHYLPHDTNYGTRVCTEKTLVSPKIPVMAPGYKKINLGQSNFGPWVKAGKNNPLLLFIPTKKKYFKTMPEWTKVHCVQWARIWLHLGVSNQHPSETRHVNPCSRELRFTLVHLGSNHHYDKKCKLKNCTKSAQATGLTNTSQLCACYSTIITKNSLFIQEACKHSCWGHANHVMLAAPKWTCVNSGTLLHAPEVPGCANPHPSESWCGKSSSKWALVPWQCAQVKPCQRN